MGLVSFDWDSCRHQDMTPGFAEQTCTIVFGRRVIGFFHNEEDIQLPDFDEDDVTLLIDESTEKERTSGSLLVMEVDIALAYALIKSCYKVYDTQETLVFEIESGEENGDAEIFYF